LLVIDEEATLNTQPGSGTGAEEEKLPEVTRSQTSNVSKTSPSPGLHAENKAPSDAASIEGKVGCRTVG